MGTRDKRRCNSEWEERGGGKEKSEKIVAEIKINKGGAKQNNNKIIKLTGMITVIIGSLAKYLFLLLCIVFVV